MFDRSLESSSDVPSAARLQQQKREFLFPQNSINTASQNTQMFIFTISISKNLKCTGAHLHLHSNFSYSLIFWNHSRDVQVRFHTSSYHEIFYLRACPINLVWSLLKDKCVYLELSSGSGRGICQLLWIRPRSRRIPARELVMIKTCRRGIRDASVKNKRKMEVSYHRSAKKQLTVFVPSQRKMPLVPPCLNLWPLLLWGLI